MHQKPEQTTHPDPRPDQDAPYRVGVPLAGTLGRAGGDEGPLATPPALTYHTVTLGAMTREGDCLAEISEQIPSGEPQIRILHVPAGLPGEHVTISVESPVLQPPKRHRRRWKPRPPRVTISEIHQPSPLRTQAPCPVFGTCGGCQLQHMRYEAQLEWKRSIVRQLLQDIGGFADPPLLETVPCDDPWHYRNHMRFSVNRDGQPGLTARGTHRVLPLTSCPIAHQHINRALNVLSQHPNPRPQLLIRCGAASGQLLIQPQPTSEVAQQLASSGTDLHSETMEENLANETFRIRPSSFFQTNTAQAEKMAQMVLNGLLNNTAKLLSFNEPSVGADLSCPPPIYRPITIADAYCGVGTFALLLSRHVTKVIAIEESASAIKDAQWNLRNVSNVEILKGKTEDLLPTLAAQLDGLVLDPPRAGCQQVVLDALVQHPIKRIVYVSCDPATLARDLNILCHQHPTYHLCSVQPLDMFPQTVHIECVAVLECNAV
jgi:23S rRNA (uracil1939-C5)-methyltransferase